MAAGPTCEHSRFRTSRSHASDYRPMQDFFISRPSSPAIRPAKRRKPRRGGASKHEPLRPGLSEDVLFLGVMAWKVGLEKTLSRH